MSIYTSGILCIEVGPLALRANFKETLTSPSVLIVCLSLSPYPCGCGEGYWVTISLPFPQQDSFSARHLYARQKERVKSQGPRELSFILSWRCGAAQETRHVKLDRYQQFFWVEELEIRTGVKECTCRIEFPLGTQLPPAGRSPSPSNDCTCKCYSC
eukprot:sb/3473109/